MSGVKRGIWSTALKASLATKKGHFLSQCNIIYSTPFIKNQPNKTKQTKPTVIPMAPGSEPQSFRELGARHLAWPPWLVCPCSGWHSFGGQCFSASLSELAEVFPDLLSSQSWAESPSHCLGSRAWALLGKSQDLPVWQV